MTPKTLRVKSTLRVCGETFAAGSMVYRGADHYGISSDDSRAFGRQHICISKAPAGVPFYSVPADEIEEVAQ